MPNGDHSNGITRESFISAWKTGDPETQAGYLYDLFHGHHCRLDNVERSQRRADIRWATVSGGLAILAITAPLIIRLLV
jgi:hypothetical protein